VLYLEQWPLAHKNDYLICAAAAARLGLPSPHSCPQAAHTACACRLHHLRPACSAGQDAMIYRCRSPLQKIAQLGCPLYERSYIKLFSCSPTIHSREECRGVPIISWSYVDARIPAPLQKNRKCAVCARRESLFSDKYMEKRVESKAFIPKILFFPCYNLTWTSTYHFIITRACKINARLGDSPGSAHFVFFYHFLLARGRNKRIQGVGQGGNVPPKKDPQK